MSAGSPCSRAVASRGFKKVNYYFKIHSSAAGYAGEKGMLDGVIVIIQSGIPRDAIAR
jgi:hypothetical protein